jgi:hypothetical protein
MTRKDGLKENLKEMASKDYLKDMKEITNVLILNSPSQKEDKENKGMESQ